MPTSSINLQELYLGIDGGGTKCKAVIVNSSNEVLGTGISGPANPFHGFEQATNSIVESAKLALIDAGLQHVPLNQLTAGLGLAGVNLPVLFKQMTQWQHPFKLSYLTTDLFIACLGAHEGKDGAVMITGTGSCGFSYVNGHSIFLGGHGFPHGDKGSGAWIGLQATEQVLLSIDGLTKETSLVPCLLEYLSVSDAVEMVEVIAGKPAAFFAQMAQYVFSHANQGDEVASNIVKDGASYISNLARKLFIEKPPRISLIGGLSPLMAPWLDKDVQAILAKPLQPPEIGAVIFARQQAKAE